MFRPFAAFALAAGLAAPVFAADTFSVDPVHTTVAFKIKHLNVSHSHGRFDDPAGTLVIDAEKPENSSVVIEVQTDKIDTDNAKRDEHLKSPDFFSAREFPTISFKSTAVKGVEGGLEVTGDLTLHGVTKPVTVTLTKVGEGSHPKAGHRIGYDTTFTIKRSDYGMSNMLDVLGDEVTMTVSIEGIKQ